MAASIRVKRGEDYRRIVRTGYRVGGKYTLVHAVLLSVQKTQPNVSRETSARFGFIITKSVGKAVTRNLIRRRMQGICLEAVQNGFTGAEVVFRVFPQAATVPYQQLRHTVLKQLAKVQEQLDAHC